MPTSVRTYSPCTPPIPVSSVCLAVAGTITSLPSTPTTSGLASKPISSLSPTSSFSEAPNLTNSCVPCSFFSLLRLFPIEPPFSLSTTCDAAFTIIPHPVALDSVTSAVRQRRKLGQQIPTTTRPTFSSSRRNIPSISHHTLCDPSFAAAIHLQTGFPSSPSSRPLSRPWTDRSRCSPAEPAGHVVFTPHGPVRRQGGRLLPQLRE